MKKSNFIDKKIKVGKFTARVIDADNPSSVDVTPEDKELDLRAIAAVKAAIKRAKVCKNPIAKYDTRKMQAYIEYPDGRKEYVKKTT